MRRAERDSVHDMRVAVRRLRAVYSLFRPYFAGNERSGLSGGSRRLGRLLGEVRDMEVLLAGCSAAAKRLPEADLAGFRARLEERRAAGRVRLLDYLDSGAYQDLHNRFERLIERNQRSGQDDNTRLSARPEDQEIEPATVEAVIPARVWRLYGRIRAYEPVVEALPDPSLHRLRIAGKRLRYTLEAFESQLGGRPSLLLDRLKALQDALGALQDAVVLIELLESFDAKAGPSDRVGPYLEEQRLGERQARAEFEKVWPAVIDADFRTQLAAAVAAI